MNKIKILVAAGGTGGHLFPALAVVEALQKITDNNIDPVFVGNPERLESNIVPKLGYNFVPLSVVGFSGLFSLKTISLPFKILQSVSTCKKIIQKNNIVAVLCAGAYLSYPAGLAAVKTGTPLFLMESNVNPGKTIKLLSAKADTIITSFEKSKIFFTETEQEKIRCFGNPMRNQFDHIQTKEEARKKLNLDPNKKTIFVFGGSLGALAINKAVEKFVENIPDDSIQIVWQTGKNYEYTGPAKGNVIISKFIEDMATPYYASDLVVSRSGATSVSEICLLGKPSILVPLPSASNNEQAENAKALVEKNATIMIDNSEILDRFPIEIGKLLANEEELERMGRVAKSFARPNASMDVANEILERIDKR